MSDEELTPLENPELDQPPGLTVRTARAEDEQAIRNIAGDWVRNPDDGTVITEEIDGIAQKLQESLSEGASATFLVAENLEGKVVGFLRLDEISPEVEKFALTENPAELFNLFVASGQNNGKGVGRTLFNKAIELARQKGHTEILLNSGPRYSKSGWGFYNKLIGHSIGEIKGHYGKGVDAKVWSKSLVDAN